MSFKIIICGARIFNNYKLLKNVCDGVVQPFQYKGYFLDPADVSVISGHAKGADLLGEQWAKSYGMQLETFPLTNEDWKDLTVDKVIVKTNAHGKYNALAGHNRNQKMLEFALADNDVAIIIGFYKGKSSGSIRIAKKAGLEHFIWDNDKWKMRK